MSFKSEYIWAPGPSTERGRPTQLSASPDGERIAYASGKSIFLRDISDPALSTQYTQHTAATTVARFSPSGYYVASGDVTGAVRVWDCKGDGATKGPFQICRRVNDLAWDGDSQRIIAVGDGKDGFGRAITTDTGNSVGEIQGHSAQINCVSIRQQRPFKAVTGSDDMNLVFYNGVPFKMNTSLQGHHQRYVYGSAFSPDGAVFVTVGSDKRICLFDGKTGEGKGRIGDGVHNGSIFSVSWSKDSKHFVTASADQTVKLWDLEAGKAIQSWRVGGEDTISPSHHQVGVVWPSRSDRTIISVSLNGTINYFSQESQTPTKSIYGHQTLVTNIDIAPSSNNTFWTGSGDGRILAWDSNGGKAREIDGASHTNLVSGIHAQDNLVTTVGWDDKMRSIDPKAETSLGSTVSLNGSPKGVLAIGKHVIVPLQDKVVSYAHGTDKPVSELKFQASAVAISSVTGSESSSECVVATDDNKFHLLTVSASGQISSTKTHQSSSSASISALAITEKSPEGRLLSAGFSNGKITVFKLPSFEEFTTRWSAHTARVTCIAWNKAGTHAASGSLDTGVWVWSLAKPSARVGVSAGAHKESVNAVRWLDEKTVISAGADGAVKTWTVSNLA